MIAAGAIFLGRTGLEVPCTAIGASALVVIAGTIITIVDDTILDKLNVVAVLVEVEGLVIGASREVARPVIEDR
jgi:hypothetical protein